MKHRDDFFFWWWFVGSIVWVTVCIGVSIYAVVWGDWRLSASVGFLELAGKFFAIAAGPPFGVLVAGVVVIKVLRALAGK